MLLPWQLTAATPWLPCPQVSLELSSFPPSHRHPAVPEGLQYYTLAAQLSELQLVFLYRFLQENLDYITTMLAMRLPPLEAAAGGDAASGAAAAAAVGAMPPASPSKAGAEGQHQGGGSGGGGAAAAAVQQAAPVQAPLQPFVLLLDVQASAPNICLPRSSGATGWVFAGPAAPAENPNVSCHCCAVLLPTSCMPALPV